MAQLYRHLGARKEKNLDVCIPCTLNNGKISGVVLQDWRECGVAV